MVSFLLSFCVLFSLHRSLSFFFRIFFTPPRTKKLPASENQLLDVGADPKATTPEGATPIVMAAQGTPGAPELQEGGAAKCVQYLLDAGVDQTERDEVGPACRGSRF